MNWLFGRLDCFTWTVYFESVDVASSVCNCIMDGWCCQVTTRGGPQSCIYKFANNC